MAKETAVLIDAHMIPLDKLDKLDQQQCERDTRVNSLVAIVCRMEAGREGT